MNVSEYIVEYLSKRGVRDYYGYQGTMIAYFIEAVCQNEYVRNHSCYNEQGAAFAACGAAKASGSCAVAYATSGPGALNLISGVADAYYDSAPVIFITGQLNTTEYTDIPQLRQQGFQQTDVVNIMKPITKYAVMVTRAEDIPALIDKAYSIATEGRPGPVVLDIPMNIQKAELDNGIINNNYDEKKIFFTDSSLCSDIINQLNRSQRPLLLIGNGIGKDEKSRSQVRALVNQLNIPVIESIFGLDILDSDDPHNMGYIGAAYGYRSANIIAYKKADLIIALGTSMCPRQTGNPSGFAAGAVIVRVDIDSVQLERKVHENDICIKADAADIINGLLQNDSPIKDYSEWLKVCGIIKEQLKEFDQALPQRSPNRLIEIISRQYKSNTVFTVDVGQHMMWSAQSIHVQGDNRVIFSGGHGAMGFALPAAIGAHYATGRRAVCITGDGSMQMNIQELQWIVRENIPVTIYVFNNGILGLIRQQQDDFFGGRYYGSSAEGGFTSPDFAALGKAYGIKSYKAESAEDLEALSCIGTDDGPLLVEVILPVTTKAYPKTYFGQEMYDQRPELPRQLMEYLIAL